MTKTFQVGQKITHRIGRCTSLVTFLGYIPSQPDMALIEDVIGRRSWVKATELEGA